MGQTAYNARLKLQGDQAATLILRKVSVQTPWVATSPNGTAGRISTAALSVAGERWFESCHVICYGPERFSPPFLFLISL